MSLFKTTTLSAANVTPDSVTAKTVVHRENIFSMTQAAEEAVLRPRDCGAFSHPLRAALAARVAGLAGDQPLKELYLAAAGDQAALADPEAAGTAQGMAAVVAFVDKVANDTRAVTAEDIATLQAARVEDADIVRLCELVAFLAYQIRVVSGLRLMQGHL